MLRVISERRLSMIRNELRMKRSGERSKEREERRKTIQRKLRKLMLVSKPPKILAKRVQIRNQIGN